MHKVLAEEGMTTPTPRIVFSSVASPNTWGIEGDPKALVFSSPSEAKRAEELFSALQRELAAAQEALYTANLDANLAVERAKAAEERAEQNAKDAERYRWLRDSASPSHQIPFVTSGADYGWGPEIVNGEPLDAAIDAAMKEKA